DLNEAALLASEHFAHSSNQADLDEIFTAFLQRQGGALELARALKLKPPPRVAAEAGLRVMSASGRWMEPLGGLLTEAAGLNWHRKPMTSAEIAIFAREVRLNGDATRGEKIFRRAEI